MAPQSDKDPENAPENEAEDETEDESGTAAGLPPKQGRGKQSARTIIEPAPLSVRFSAAILDIGLLVFVLICISLAWRLFMEIPIGQMRYEPPDHDDAIYRLIRSILLYLGLAAYAAAWISSPFQSTPGMWPLHVQVHNQKGEKIRFWRAFIWFLLAFAPLVLASYLVLSGLALQYSLLHIGRLNIFSFLILLQAAWFLWMFAGPDRRTVHDTLAGVALDHKTRPFSHPILKHIAFLPLSGVAVLFLSSALFIAGINLVDQKLDPSLKRYESTTSDLAGLYWEFQRDDAPYSVYRGGVDFSCGAHDPRFYRESCPPPEEIAKILRVNRHLINAYWRDFERYNATSPELLPYIYREGIKLTDLVMVHHLRAFEQATPQERDALFQQYLGLALRWAELMRQPHFLNMKTSISIQLNHLILALPIMLDQQPELLAAHRPAILELAAPIALDERLAEQILAFQYLRFSASLHHARIDYFPLILPDATHNLFIYKRRQINDMLSEHDFSSLRNRAGLQGPVLDENQDDLSQSGPLARMVLSLYNPLGRAIYNEIDQTTRRGVITFSSYRLSNSLRRMLKVMVNIKDLDLPPEEIPAYLESLPPELRFPFKDQEIHYNAQGRYLFHGAPGFPGARHILRF